MAHIHSEPGQHDTTVSAYIVRMDDSLGEPKFMLHRHKKLGKYLQFGGHVELNENPWDAIVHELAEESGYALDQLQLVLPKNRLKSLDGATLHPTPICHNTHSFDPEGNHKHSDIGYLFIATEEPLGTLDEGESEEIELFSRSELIDLKDSCEILINVFQIAEYCFDVVQNLEPNWEIVEASSL